MRGKGWRDAGSSEYVLDEVGEELAFVEFGVARFMPIIVIFVSS